MHFFEKNRYLKFVGSEYQIAFFSEIFKKFDLHKNKNVQKIDKNDEKYIFFSARQNVCTCELSCPPCLTKKNVFFFKKKIVKITFFRDFRYSLVHFSSFSREAKKVKKKNFNFFCAESYSKKQSWSVLW